MDEIAPHGVTDVWEVRDGHVASWTLDPARHRLAIDDVGTLRGGDPAGNARRVERLLADGRDDAPGSAAVLLNAAAALYVAGLARSYDEGLSCAREALGAGRGREALERLRRASVSTSG
jgi:anthranilate phosphoribosyltransferase